MVWHRRARRHGSSFWWYNREGEHVSAPGAMACVRAVIKSLPLRVFGKNKKRILWVVVVVEVVVVVVAVRRNS